MEWNFLEITKNNTMKFINSKKENDEISENVFLQIEKMNSLIRDFMDSDGYERYSCGC